MKPLQLLCAAVLLASAGCGHPAIAPPKVGPRELGPPRVVAGELDARALLATLPARATQSGAGPVSIVAAGEMTEGERLGGFIELPDEACLLAYARGSSSVDDVDVAIFSDEGAPLAVDEAPDAHPTVVLCPPHPSRVYVGAHTAQGEGLVAVGAQLVPPDRVAAVAKEVGARGATGGGPRPADSWPGLDDAVRAHRSAIGGNWEDVHKVVLSADARAPTYMPFSIEADQCSDFLVLPGDDVSLLEVEAFDLEGRLLGRAREGERSRTLTLCSPLAVSGTLAVRPHVGRGRVAVVLGRARTDRARDLSQRANIVWTAPALPLGQAKSERNATLKDHGYDPAPRASTDGTLLLGRRASVPLDLHGLTTPCARVDVVGGAPLALVEAHGWDDAGALVASGEGSASVTLFLCTHDKARIDLETRGRPGPFSTLVRAEPWSDPSFTAHPLAAARMLARAAQGPEMLLEGQRGPVRALTLDAAKMSSFTRTLTSGQCLQVAAGAQGDGVGLEVRLFDALGDELDRSYGATAASARACAAEGKTVAVRVELRTMSGKLDVVVGERN